jgi:hypothetical protein
VVYGTSEHAADLFVQPAPESSSDLHQHGFTEGLGEFIGHVEGFYAFGQSNIPVYGGSTPKDGPSAGGGIALALASLLLGQLIRREVAMMAVGFIAMVDAVASGVIFSMRCCN